MNVILNILEAEPKHAKDRIPLFKAPLYYDFEDKLDNSRKGGHTSKL